MDRSVTLVSSSHRKLITSKNDLADFQPNFLNAEPDPNTKQARRRQRCTASVEASAQSSTNPLNRVRQPANAAKGGAGLDISVSQLHVPGSLPLSPAPALEPPAPPITRSVENPLPDIPGAPRSNRHKDKRIGVIRQPSFTPAPSS